MIGAILRWRRARAHLVAADLVSWKRVEAEIAARALALCAVYCPDPKMPNRGCLGCDAARHNGARRDALKSLRDELAPKARR